ncbi:MAG TPA: nuclear transport factor 2 family protein [Vicinamibacteria bacterium]|nr:nuclear transport factor 2 family protein [Vicinamibacteria bacterium]
MKVTGGEGGSHGRCASAQRGLAASGGIMNRMSLLTPALIAAAFVTVSGCDGRDNPAPGNAKPANTNAPRPAAEAPTINALMALDKQANEAFVKGDSKSFAGLLSEKFVMREGGQRMDKPAVVKMVAGLECDVETWSLDEHWMARIDADTYVLSYRSTWEGTCTGPDGTPTKIPSPTRAATVWVRSGHEWQAAFHGENPIIDPKDSPRALPAPPAKPAEKAEARTADLNTDALLAAEKAVWEAWKAHDAERLEDLTASGLSFIDIFGNSYANKADTIRAWAGAICQVESVGVTDGVVTALSPTVKLLMHKGTAEGTCYGERVPAVHGNSVYVRDGDRWKLAFTMNMFAM